jgi:hypothetical protein
MIPENCASCLAWHHRGDTEIGLCERHAKPTLPIDGEPAWAYPFKRGNDGCRHYIAQTDTALALKRQGMVRAILQERAA